MPKMTIDRREKFAAAVMSNVEPFTEEDSILLADILQTQCVVKALSHIFRIADGFKEHLLILDLGTQEGITVGLRLQGQHTGILMFLELILNLATEPQEEDE